MRTYPKVVQQIHSEFMSAGDVLLKQANDILQKAGESVIQKGERLAKLGFTQTHEAVNASKILKQKEISEATAKLVLHYQMRYPNNKFINEDQVNEICKKYGLVCAPIECYMGFVPNEKLSEIESFSFNNEDVRESLLTCHLKFDKSFLILPTGRSWISVWSRFWWTLPRVIEGNFSSEYRVNEFFQEKYGVPFEYIVGSIENRQEIISDFYICAPKKDMDLKGLSKYGIKYSSHKTIPAPDPVVLKPVKGGYLVVAAWGDEASDDIVVNQKMN